MLVSSAVKKVFSHEVPFINYWTYVMFPLPGSCSKSPFLCQCGGEVCFLKATKKEGSCFLIQTVSLCLSVEELRPLLILRITAGRCELPVTLWLLCFPRCIKRTINTLKRSQGTQTTETSHGKIRSQCWTWLPLYKSPSHTHVLLSCFVTHLA